MAEVKVVISKMKRGKVAGTDEITLKIVLALEEGMVWLHSVLDAVWKEMCLPNDLLETLLVPIYENIGNIH